ncbi:MAG TPA: GNAT family N-acetyltransferase [Acidobacteriaceae bacterium]|jgi:aminoglycoside 6'-N-acetyltransferase I|nr:GNAT family N-acetyltransferase [Acidobacteriaceae bacterium]
MLIRPAHPADLEPLADLLYALWPESPREEHHRELAGKLAGRNTSTLPAIYFVAESAGHRIIGFLEAGLRSHADCCDTAHAVGYIEGWFVEESYRRQGVGHKLVTAAEEWARSLGCREMASDAYIDNGLSQRAHEALGYEPVSRSVLYRKEL